MATVDINVLDATGNKHHRASVPDDAPIGRIVSKLVDALNLPLDDPSGQEISYKLQQKSTGLQLDPMQTLAQTGVVNGDYLRILPEMIAG